MKKLGTVMNGSFEDQSWAEVNKRITLRTYWLTWQKMIFMTASISSQTITQISTTLLITLTSLPLVSLEDRLHGLFWNISRNQNQGFTGGKSYLEQKNCKLFWTWVKSMSKNSSSFLSRNKIHSVIVLSSLWRMCQQVVTHFKNFILALRQETKYSLNCLRTRQSQKTLVTHLSWCTVMSNSTLILVLKSLCNF
jgi:hypothetical protein